MRQRILVVDDEPDIVELVAFNLRTEGYEVITADNGADALDQAKSGQPDLIILDLMLPEMDGMAVCEILREIPATAAIPIIMLTAWSSDLSRKIGLGLGAEDYMVKPFSPRELVNRVNCVLGRKGSLQPNRR
jgi:two-component system alkaline phosphatase synthesis response regulator PhoP